MAERVGLRTVVHAYIDVIDSGENLVGKLGLQTVPTHVLVDSAGKLVSVLARKQFPDGPTVEALVTNADEDYYGDIEACQPCVAEGKTEPDGDGGSAS
jgi:hypothetical protein